MSEPRQFGAKTQVSADVFQRAADHPIGGVLYGDLLQLALAHVLAAAEGRDYTVTEIRFLAREAFFRPDWFDVELFVRVVFTEAAKDG